LAELRAFIEQARSWDVTARREAATRILDAHWKMPQAHWFLTEPLRKQFLKRVLEEWRAVEPGNPFPHDTSLFCAVIASSCAMLL
jgi:hypothetical protein